MMVIIVDNMKNAYDNMYIYIYLLLFIEYIFYQFPHIPLPLLAKYNQVSTWVVTWICKDSLTLTYLSIIVT